MARVNKVELPDGLLSAARDLDLAPRTHRWRSLTSCVLDAVWSIGVTYDSHVVRYVRAVFADMDGGDPLTTELLDPGSDPTPLSDFRTRFPTAEDLMKLTSRHLTSPRSGIRKADAALRYADVLRADGVDTMADARSCLQDKDRAAALTAELKRIPGDGVRTGYFWMLVGADDLVKPDRHALEWLGPHVPKVDVDTARQILDQLATTLSSDPGHKVTPAQLDHAIWRHRAR